MARIVMLAAVIFSWRDQVPGPDGKPIDGPLHHKAPEIGEELEVPDKVIANLKREWWAPAPPPTPDASRATGGTSAPPTPHLAAKVS